jgi:hypothetical protein
MIDQGSRRRNLHVSFPFCGPTATERSVNEGGGGTEISRYGFEGQAVRRGGGERERRGEERTHREDVDERDEVERRVRPPGGGPERGQHEGGVVDDRDVHGVLLPPLCWLAGCVPGVDGAEPGGGQGNQGKRKKAGCRQAGWGGYKISGRFG